MANGFPKRIGIHFNFSPVLDINTNAKRVWFRSFGEDKRNVVTNHALALNDGLPKKVMVYSEL
jgi:beta-glucosidase-like glycosyl hydrolase